MIREQIRAHRKMIWVLIACAGFGILLFVGMIFYVQNVITSTSQDRIYPLRDMDSIPEAKVAMVLGARVFPDGRLSAVLKDRVDAGIDLYKAGKVEKLLMSGDNRTAKYNEVSAMRKYAIKHGVASDDVVRDFAGFRTYDSVYRAKEIWGLDRVLIVSQQFHLPRAIYIAQSMDMDAYGIAASETRYRVLAKLKIRERLAWLLAWVDVQAGRDPYFLGPKEALSGDAQTTRVDED